MKNLILLFLMFVGLTASSQTFEIPKKYKNQIVKRDWVLVDTVWNGYIKKSIPDFVEQTLSENEIPDEWFTSRYEKTRIKVGDTTVIRTDKRRLDIYHSGGALLYLQREWWLQVQIPNDKAYVIKESLKEAQQREITNLNAIWNFIYSDTLTFPPAVTPPDTIQ